MIAKDELTELLFPHSAVRKIQDSMVMDVKDAVRNKKSMVIHAPTGIGKTAGVLAPCLSYALKNDLTVFFLTNRHTQHLIAVNTLKKIKEKHSKEILVADIIGKKWMCLVPGVENLYNNDFIEYCKTMKEDNKCEFYSNTKNKSKLSIKANKVFSEIKHQSPCNMEKVKEICSLNKLCAYEMSTELAKKANVIITDYYYLFHPDIRQSFFSKTNKELEKSIIIIDEGHNLASRVRDLMTSRLSTVMLRRSASEAKKFKYSEAGNIITEIRNILENFTKDLGIGEEKLIEKEDFINKVNQIGDYDEIISDFEFIGDAVRETKKQSNIGSLSKFLSAWKGDDNGFVRIIEKTYKSVILSYRCLDPSLVTKDVLDNAYSSIIMSGTLTPTDMYKDLLSFPKNSIEKTYKSPFPDKNKLTLIIPETTTKYSMRSDSQFRRMARICADIVNDVPGSSALFFPSYKVRDMVNHYFSKLCKKTTFLEKSNLTKQEKEEMLERFKEYKKDGACLLSVTSGSFGEGIDLPGVLKSVVVVGIPLPKPDLEAKALINYYNNKFGKGMEYGYIFPAFNKALQSAGRCIRSSKDRGILIFLDQRYVWPMYSKCFPSDWDIKVTKDYTTQIDNFFSEK